MDKKKKDFILAGVGGQGTILASDILMEVGLALGYDVKKSEVHGMSQRGGAVESHVRWGERVFSPLAEKGRVDYLVGFEMLEAARWPSYLLKGGTAVVNRYRIPPPAVNLGQARYPEEREIDSLLAGRAGRVWWVPATEMAQELGNAAVAGVVLLGALSTLLEGEEALWLDVIERTVPAKFVALNKQAFLAGRRAG
ncbi:indolepyruvate oxidoreductase subunit beta [Desulfotomaculum copahuensis]|uniref:Pyruvate/ketoisovalerate oxidoreductase catalytic domain-containing protein n=1 Tax=Desulfotomaculum copahuensis TaxID=1838280 RepID=A0A1B7LGN2_9FIRM|nr:indolepyruvate oxidoreductase subunit beta [Desulfotomaculum copahuensis]OAT85262.1 hypothetical protein A6M21_06900 [Desulfotomaculum copahuensis]